MTNVFGAEVRHTYLVAFEVKGPGELVPLLVKLDGKPVSLPVR